MIATHPDCPASVTLLADHLDTALAIGEDLVSARLPARADLDEADPETAPDALDDFVRRVRRLEASLLLRILQARRLVAGMAHADANVKAASGLFIAQTELLADMMATAARDGGEHARATVESHAYLRSRGLLAPEAAAPSPYEALGVTEAFRVGGIAPLAGMLDLVSALLDLLDARFGLYAPELAEDAVLPPAPEPLAEPAVAITAPAGDDDALSLTAAHAVVSALAVAERAARAARLAETDPAIADATPPLASLVSEPLPAEVDVAPPADPLASEAAGSGPPPAEAAAHASAAAADAALVELVTAADAATAAVDGGAAAEGPASLGARLAQLATEVPGDDARQAIDKDEADLAHLGVR